MAEKLFALEKNVTVLLRIRYAALQTILTYGNVTWLYVERSVKILDILPRLFTYATSHKSTK